jgi:hypothetical protein
VPWGFLAEEGEQELSSRGEGFEDEEGLQV